jgi:hypothetical protein
MGFKTYARYLQIERFNPCELSVLGAGEVVVAGNMPNRVVKKIK